MKFVSFFFILFLYLSSCPVHVSRPSLCLSASLPLSLPLSPFSFLIQIDFFNFLFFSFVWEEKISKQGNYSQTHLSMTFNEIPEKDRKEIWTKGRCNNNTKSTLRRSIGFLQQQSIAIFVFCVTLESHPHELEGDKSVFIVILLTTCFVPQEAWGTPSEYCFLPSPLILQGLFEGPAWITPRNGFVKLNFTTVSSGSQERPTVRPWNVVIEKRAESQ